MIHDLRIMVERRDLEKLVDKPSPYPKALLSFIGSRPNYSRSLRMLNPNGNQIAELSQRFHSLSSSLDILQDSLEEINKKLSDSEFKLRSLGGEAFQIKNFTIANRIEMLDGTSPNAYVAIDLGNYSEVAIIADFWDVPASPMNRMRVTLPVKFVGQKAFTRYDAFGGSTLVGLPTYESVHEFNEAFLENVNARKKKAELEGRKENETTMLGPKIREAELELLKQFTVLFKVNNF